MTDLAEMRARWKALGVRLFVRREPDGTPRLRAKVPPGIATPEIRAELAVLKAALLASWYRDTGMRDEGTDES
jgi:hypothetical protein